MKVLVLLEVDEEVLRESENGSVDAAMGWLEESGITCKEIRPVAETVRGIDDVTTHFLNVPVPGGTLRADVSQDADYPGIDIEYISDTDNGNFTRPRVLVEYPQDGELRALVWQKADSEDYTESVEFKNVGKGPLPIGTAVDFDMEVGDLTPVYERLHGVIIESDEEHITIRTQGNDKMPWLNDLRYWMDKKMQEEYKVKAC